MNARSLARHYAMLASGGQLDGVQILSPERIRLGSELQSYEWDEVYRVRIRRALGWRRGPDSGPGATDAAFGHVGGGGSFGYADPSRRFAIGFAKNYFTYAGGTPRRAGHAVADAVINALGI